MSDLSDAHGRGYLSRLPHYNSVFNYLDDPALTPIFTNLIATSSLPLRAVETDFAVDATGFSTSGTVTWLNKRYGHDQANSDWLKVHMMCGVTTNVVTSVTVTGGFAHDAPHLPELVETTAQRFAIREVSADKAYASVRHLEAVPSTGATPYIAFNNNADRRRGRLGALAADVGLLHLPAGGVPGALPQAEQRRDYRPHDLKAKFGGKLRSKSKAGQVNEALSKVLCHNICVVAQSVRELGVEPMFRSGVFAT
jgi:hypothetical protein